MAKLTDKDITGTSFHGTVINATYNELVAAIGEPQTAENTGEDKVNFRWECETEDGSVFTIYDYKEYRPIGLNEVIEWHVGAFDSISGIIGADEVIAQID